MLLFYTAIVLPYRISFVDELNTSIFVLDLMIDLCFFTDIVITFFTAIQDPISGRYEIRKKKLAMMYLKGWFIIDVVTTIPW